MLTQHTLARSQQRGIPPMLIDLLLTFGVSEKVPGPGGAEKVFFDKSSRKRVRVYAGPLASLLDRHLDIYAVVVDGNKVITIGHRLERIKTH